MKVKKYLKEARDEFEKEQQKKISKIVKKSLKRIDSAKRTLAKLEKEHKRLLEMDVEELELEEELEDFEY